MTAERLLRMEIQSISGIGADGGWNARSDVLTLTNGMLRFEDTIDTSGPHRFYRIIER